MIVAEHNDIFSNVYICAWIAKWDCQVHGRLCKVIKNYARSHSAKMIAASFIVRTITEAGGVRYERGPRQQLHRVDGPAIEEANGTKEWWVNGRRHRVDGPAVEYHTGYKSWWENGLIHRVGGPAVETSNGYKYWYLNGERHRVDGPAVENPDGFKEWWINDERHRIDGPAVESPDGSKEWWVNGRRHPPG